MARFATGDTVFVTDEKGDRYPADIAAVSGDSYKVRYWEGGRAKTVAASAVSPLEADAIKEHRFKVGEEVIVSLGSGSWHPATITSKIRLGYGITWTNGGTDGRALESDVERLPELAAASGELAIGDAVLAYYEPDIAYYPGTISAAYADEYDVVWDLDESESRVRADEVRMLPRQPRANAETANGNPLPEHRPDDGPGDVSLREAFNRYLLRRQEAKEVVLGDVEDDFHCLGCKKLHPNVQWYKSKKHDNKFHLCERGEAPVVVSCRLSDGSDVRPYTLEEFMRAFHAGKTEPKRFHEKVAVDAKFKLFGFELGLKDRKA